MKNDKKKHKSIMAATIPEKIERYGWRKDLMSYHILCYHKILGGKANER